MSTEGESRIKQLCENYRKSILQPDGSSGFEGDSEKYRLTNNEIYPHQLDHDELLTSIVELSKLLIHPRLNTVIHTDHHFMWSWCGEILLGSSPRANCPAELYEHGTLYITVIQGALARLNHPEDIPYLEWVKLQERVQNHFATNYIENSSLAIAYLAFPLLEGLLKQICKDFVSMNGLVTQEFKAPRPNNQNKKTRTYKINDTCSSVSDLLHLHYDYVAPPALTRLIDQFKDHLHTLDTTIDPFSLIYKWRNQSLHGTTSFTTIGTTILNYCLLLSIYGIAEGYIENRDKTFSVAIHKSKTRSIRNRSDFYPPF